MFIACPLMYIYSWNFYHISLPRETMVFFEEKH